MNNKSLIKEKVAEWLQTLPIKDHIKEWKILHESVLLPAKNGVDHTKWDMKLHTRIIDNLKNTIYLVIGVRV